MASQDELNAEQSRVPNQKGSASVEPGGRSTHNVDITKVAPDRLVPSSAQVADPGLTGSRPAKGGGSNG